MKMEVQEYCKNLENRVHIKVGVIVRNEEEAGLYLDLPIDFLAIGNEGCVHLLPNLEEVESFEENRLKALIPEVITRQLFLDSN